MLLNLLGADDLAWQFLGISGARPRRPLDLAGVALGGPVVLQDLARHPGRIRSAVIACGSVRSEGTRQDAVRKVAVGQGLTAMADGTGAVAEPIVIPG